MYRVIDLQPKQVGPQGGQGSARPKELKGFCRQLSGQNGKGEGTHHLVLHIILHGYFGHSRRMQRGVGSSIRLWFRMPRQQQVPALKAAGIFGVRGFLADCCGRGSAEYRPHDAWWSSRPTERLRCLSGVVQSGIWALRGQEVQKIHGSEERIILRRQLPRAHLRLRRGRRMGQHVGSQKVQRIEDTQPRPRSGRKVPCSADEPKQAEFEEEKCPNEEPAPNVFRGASDRGL